ncbi:hypothetical protein [Pseudodesulfovibrio indicus]|uniref:Uncharacterized protein n=1 Tax=Pseudodesulfovibrio indicus TaxID=1716143 RepID=A0A126QQZ6_9BACT|nr:hypothetical protein [Pseudodesulfovibrio indicus]AMK12473.1 hypothetical protein AWY79_15875 [Pseudodesulfovibrio indicus]TDT90778.1 hypothetical protein EDC59_102208 [Pseudodesulfovibrio indicus]
MAYGKRVIPECANCWTSDPGMDADNGWGNGTGLGHETGGNSSGLSDPRVNRFTEAQQRGILGSGLGFSMMGTAADDVEAYYKQLDYTARQNAIRERAAQKRAAEIADLQSLADAYSRGKLSEFDRIQGVKALNRGALGELEGYLGKPSSMRQTHNIGGIWGGMFDTKSDDVQTSYEDRADLQASGHMDKQGNTIGWGPMNPVGFLSSITAAPVSQMAAKKAYDYTGSIPAALTVGGVTGASMWKGGRTAQPDYFSEIASGYTGTSPTGLLSAVPSAALSIATGAPVGLVGQALGSVNTAAKLNSLGITARKEAPTSDNYGSDGVPWWWPVSMGRA